METENRVALVAGATGLVGREILAILLADKHYQAVYALGRHAPALQHPRLHTLLTDLAQLPQLPALGEVYLALGTTLKAAGSQTAFEAVDYTANVAIARAGIDAGAIKLGAVSALGADPDSPLFYNRIKGRTEQALRLLGYRTLVLARPSLLAGERAALGQAARTGERLGLLASRCLGPLIPRAYRPVAARDVAQALVHAVQRRHSGVELLSSGAMQGAASA
ncbi:MAG: nucleoside-diphosphate sugar epimerase [Rhodoferax sp.]